MQVRNLKMRYIVTALFLVLANCSKSGKTPATPRPSNQHHVDYVDFDTEVRRELSLEEHIEYLKQKREAWVKSNDRSYKFSAYMEPPLKNGYIEATFEVHAGDVRVANVVYDELSNSDAVRLPSLLDLFDRALSALQKLRQPNINQHCSVDYSMDESRLYIEVFMFTCDDFLPDMPAEHYEIFSVWTL